MIKWDTMGHTNILYNNIQKIYHKYCAKKTMMNQKAMNSSLRTIVYVSNSDCVVLFYFI